jgi:hypothetical protein
MAHRLGRDVAVGLRLINFRCTWMRGCGVSAAIRQLSGAGGSPRIWIGCAGEGCPSPKSRDHCAVLVEMPACRSIAAAVEEFDSRLVPRAATQSLNWCVASEVRLAVSGRPRGAVARPVPMWITSQRGGRVELVARRRVDVAGEDFPAPAFSSRGHSIGAWVLPARSSSQCHVDLGRGCSPCASLDIQSMRWVGRVGRL